MVEPVGIEPTLPPCKGGVLPLNYGPVKNSRAASPMLTATRQGDLRKPAGNVEAVIPMTTAPATMAVLLFGFRTNHRGPSPGNDRVGKLSLPVRGEAAVWNLNLFDASSFVVGFTENPSAPATLVTLLDTPAVPSRPVCGLSRRLDTRPCEPRSRLRWGLFCSHTPIAQGLPAAQAVCPAGWRWYLAPWGRVPGLPRRS